jgi:predicted transcriptional regulator
MATTTIHLPDDLLEALDSVAARRKLSRNRLVIEACRRLVEQDLGEWPAGFFDRTRLTPEERRELVRAGEEVERAIVKSRRSRKRPPF